nr:SprT-like domain-containing protein [Paenibacillus phytohabitans]
MFDVKSLTLSDITKEIHHVFKLFNLTYFEGILSTPAITIQSNGHHRLSMGWCSTKPVWGTQDGSLQMYELNLSAEFMDQDFFETMDTVLHEMVHLYHLTIGIQDTSRKGAYHNKNFKQKVLELGFEYQEDKPHPTHGWSYARLGKEAKKKIEEMPIRKEIFVIARHGYTYFKALAEGKDPAEVMSSGIINNNESSSKSIKWICSSCGVSVRAYNKNLNILCGDCDQRLEME